MIQNLLKFCQSLKTANSPHLKKGPGSKDFIYGKQPKLIGTEVFYSKKSSRTIGFELGIRISDNHASDREGKGRKGLTG
jgi:hypothetical protein